MKNNLEKHMNDTLKCSMIELLHQLMLDATKEAILNVPTMSNV
jgi:hypothetical protein